jgi:hypothetical protein
VILVLVGQLAVHEYDGIVWVVWYMRVSCVFIV